MKRKGAANAYANRVEGKVKLPAATPQAADTEARSGSASQDARPGVTRYTAEVQTDDGYRCKITKTQYAGEDTGYYIGFIEDPEGNVVNAPTGNGFVEHSPTALAVSALAALARSLKGGD